MDPVLDPSMFGAPAPEGQGKQPEGGDPQGNPGPGGGQPGGEGDPQGAGGAPQTVKIGDKELTLDQVAELEKKASDYDALLPEFTKKSQRLSEFEKLNKTEQNPDADKPFYMQKGWKPQTYEELQQALVLAEERGLKRAIDTIDGRETTKAEAKKQWDGFVDETTKADKSFDKNAFAQFVVRHNLPITGIDAMKSAYGVYKEVIDAKLGKGGKPAGQASPVGAPKGGQPAPAGIPYQQIHGSRSALDLIQGMFTKK